MAFFIFLLLFVAAGNLLKFIRFLILQIFHELKPKSFEQKHLRLRTSKEFAKFIYEDSFLDSKSLFRLDDVVNYYNKTYSLLNEPMTPEFMIKCIQCVNMKIIEKEFRFKMSKHDDIILFVDTAKSGFILKTLFELEYLGIIKQYKNKTVN